MTSNTRSVRVTDEQVRFLDQSNFELSSETREWLEDKRVEAAAGRCASCGATVYPSGHTVVSSGTPLGNALGLVDSQEIDLCGGCSDDAMDAMADEGEDLELSYIEWWGDYSLYEAEREAVMGAGPGERGSKLVETAVFKHRDDRYEVVQEWALSNRSSKQVAELDAKYEANAPKRNRSAASLR